MQDLKKNINDEEKKVCVWWESKSFYFMNDKLTAKYCKRQLAHFKAELEKSFFPDKKKKIYW